jgi:hypothetical protein
MRNVAKNQCWKPMNFSKKGILAFESSEEVSK